VICACFVARLDLPSTVRGKITGRDTVKKAWQLLPIILARAATGLHRHNKPKAITMTSFALSLFPQMQDSFAISQIKAALLEPFLVTALGLFWLTALLIGALTSAVFAAYDTMISLHVTALRLPRLWRNAATNPLVLRRNGRAHRGENSRASRSSQTARALEN
jgi:hypothetical protein